MSDKLDKIKELIPLLDEKKDFLLLCALKSEITKEKIQYLSKHEVTPNEERKAKQGLAKTLYTFLINEDKYYNKIQKIIDKSVNCENCKHAVVKNGTVYADNDSKICNSEFRRLRVLYDIQEKIENENKRCIEEVINNNKDLVKYKAIINKINLKIYKLKQKNYATS